MASGTYQPGDRIAGRYEVGEVHRGGMGLVYVVREHRDGHPPRTLALKTLREEFLRDRDRSQRFATECHLWVRLGAHPNLVRALALEEIDGRPFVVLEYIDGGDLTHWIGTPRLDLRRALGFGIQFCLGMEQALRAGLACHRDIKPANLLIGRDGTLRIADFGLVRLRDEFRAAGIEPSRPIPLADSEGAPEPIVWTDPDDQRDDGPSGPVIHPDATTLEAPDPFATNDYRPDADRTPSSRLTNTGWLLGTLPYMAPEQFGDASRVDVRADIYAFGVVLFEMLAAQRPFRGKSAAMLRRQHERYAPPSLQPFIPRRHRGRAHDIDAVVQRCLRKNPDERFHSTAAFRDALSRILKRLDQPSWWPFWPSG
jgi:serine/threonine protein kinase